MLVHPSHSSGRDTNHQHPLDDHAIVLLPKTQEKRLLILHQVILIQ
jgi:hypothetical protein